MSQRGWYLYHCEGWAHTRYRIWNKEYQVNIDLFKKLKSYWEISKTYIVIGKKLHFSFQHCFLLGWTVSSNIWWTQFATEFLLVGTWKTGNIKLPQKNYIFSKRILCKKSNDKIFSGAQLWFGWKRVVKLTYPSIVSESKIRVLIIFSFMKRESWNIRSNI